MKFKKSELSKIKKASKYFKENPELKISGITAEEFEEKVKELIKTDDKVQDLKLAVFETKKDREDLYLEVHEIEMRINSAMVGFFGRDSKETKDIGFKTKSDRKKYTRKSKEEKARELIAKAEEAKIYLESLKNKE